jgi:hypothetical protein
MGRSAIITGKEEEGDLLCTNQIEKYLRLYLFLATPREVKSFFNFSDPLNHLCEKEKINSVNIFELKRI